MLQRVKWGNHAAGRFEQRLLVATYMVNLSVAVVARVLRIGLRYSVPEFDGTILTIEWKQALWAAQF
jgi:hypothetical protein